MAGFLCERYYVTFALCCRKSACRLSQHLFSLELPSEICYKTRVPGLGGKTSFILTWYRFVTTNSHSHRHGSGRIVYRTERNGRTVNMTSQRCHRECWGDCDSSSGL